ncbi:class A beta-lactamase [Streptomyces sp. TRM43335]|uniref:Class A beta-lactamase n=1 Tax=Streptomyces taklimakanensis TaxID=2569853 RepID=A0A6G2BJJ2_9ACTN|nr:class A beta-lactamase [Streptomyces taklimakanensis]MTE22384.1 class A beta-lactamase [Streptomyces taklimakanensis]
MTKAARPAVTRRTLLGMAALLSSTGCGKSGGASPAASHSPSPSVAAARRPHGRLIELERKFDARLGVYALATGTGATIAHRADERFAFCSMFKVPAVAAVLHRNPLSHLDTVVRYTEDDLMRHSPVTRRHVDTGMTIRRLCDAAIRYSDGTAGNLLLRELGGPAHVTAYARGIGDTVTRMDRVEPAITEATPGDPRDTTSPRAFGTGFHRIVLGDALTNDKRAFLRDLLERNTTGAHRIRAVVPRGWTIANKTGTGDYGTLNDTAIVWPARTAPLVVTIMSGKAARDAEYDEALIAEAAAYAMAVLT